MSLFHPVTGQKIQCLDYFNMLTNKVYGLQGSSEVTTAGTRLTCICRMLDLEQNPEEPDELDS